MREVARKQLTERVADALIAIHKGEEFPKSAEHLLDVLKYASSRRPDEQEPSLREKVENNPTRTKARQLLIDESTSVKIICQVTSTEVKKAYRGNPEAQQGTLLKEGESFEADNLKSFMFAFAELKKDHYNRTDLANMTRAANQEYKAPCVIFFKYANNDKMSVGLIGRRPNRLRPDEDVLLNVSLIKDINLANPHRAHIEILTQLSLMLCVEWIVNNGAPTNFDGLLRAWLATLDIKELNKRFYRELSSWFRWAKKGTKFPTEEKTGLKQEEHIMRLLVRILFVWFIKEKGLVAEQLFNPADINGLLKEFNTTPKSDSYYRAVLQNLFFATLNTEIEKRDFSSGKRKTHRNLNLYRYEGQMKNPDKLMELFQTTPFINGGLFDCLDDFEAAGRRIDCFSDKDWGLVSVPDCLFFARANSKSESKGLIELLRSYKFTVEENTPIEQDVALDPELLGQVFEELLGEVKKDPGDESRSNRKDTGSYYTPREVVDYMVNEALIAKFASLGIEEDKLDYLLDYASDYDDAGAFFEPHEKKGLVNAIARLRILDPAGGSGAFPMGILSKLNLALHRLDPENEAWRATQIELATEKTRKTLAGETDENTREDQLTTINHNFEIHKGSDFGRKLYLIQNCIFGVDIQPIACQIAKLRFFISLAIEQSPNDNPRENYGIQPLPNLETHFVGVDTLIVQDIEGGQTKLLSEEAHKLREKLTDNRERYFNARTRQTKLKIREENKQLREQLAQEFVHVGVDNDVAERVANWDPYDQNALAEWFDPDYMFGVQDGFDIVIGNPPYIQLQKNGGVLANRYEDQGYETFVRTGDIYVLFYERGHRLLASDGYLCYITSHQWLRAEYGKKLRAYLPEEACPLLLVDFRTKVFEAGVDVNILLLGKQLVDNPKVTTRLIDDLENLGTRAKGPEVEIPSGGSSWLIPTSTIELTLKTKVEKVGTPLKEWEIKIDYGIKTGYNPAFVITGARRREILADCSDEAEHQRTKNLIRPLLRGKDIDSYCVNWKEESYIIGTFPSLKLDIAQYPAIEKHLLRFGKDKLQQSGVHLPDGTKARKKTGNRWFETQDQISYHARFKEAKLIYSRIVSSPQFAYDEDGIYPLDTMFIMTASQGSLQYLCGILNSRLGWYIFKKYYVGNSLGPKGYEYRKQYLERFPIPLIMDVNSHIAGEIEELVDQITASKKQNPSADTKAWEQKIDELVYQLYGLDDAEIKMVEDAVQSWR